MKNGCNYLRKATIIAERIGRSLFVFITTTKRNQRWESMSMEKKGCDKVVDSEGNPFKLKLYPPLRNIIECLHLAKGGSILEYRAKTFALLKPRSSCPLITLAL
jgi:hypothetical protein